MPIPNFYLRIQEANSSIENTQQLSNPLFDLFALDSGGMAKTIGSLSLEISSVVALSCFSTTERATIRIMENAYNNGCV